MRDLLVFVVVAWMIIGTGLLLYFRPLSVAARGMRMVVLAAMFGSAVAMSLHREIPMTSGNAYLSVGLPWGHDVKLYGPYEYFFYRPFPILKLGSLIIAAIGPISYLLKTHQDLVRR
jgi:hypothetical protein